MTKTMQKDNDNDNDNDNENDNDNVIPVVCDPRLPILQTDSTLDHPGHLPHLALDEVDTAAAGHALHLHPGLAPNLHEYIWLVLC